MNFVKHLPFSSQGRGLLVSPEQVYSQQVSAMVPIPAMAMPAQLVSSQPAYDHTSGGNQSYASGEPSGSAASEMNLPMDSSDSLFEAGLRELGLTEDELRAKSMELLLESDDMNLQVCASAL